jgi:hypothetical protein
LARAGARRSPASGGSICLEDQRQRSGTAITHPLAVTSRQRVADRLYGGDVSRASTSWRRALEAALDREARARRDFGRRREKWEKERKSADELRRRRMPAEQRRDLERKEHDVRMRAIYAELDEKDKARAVRALMEVVSDIRHGRIDRVQHFLASIADAGCEGVTAARISQMVAPRGAHLLTPEQRDGWGRKIAEALVTGGILAAVASDLFVLKKMPPDQVHPSET